MKTLGTRMKSKYVLQCGSSTMPTLVLVSIARRVEVYKVLKHSPHSYFIALGLFTRSLIPIPGPPFIMTRSVPPAS